MSESDSPLAFGPDDWPKRQLIRTGYWRAYGEPPRRKHGGRLRARREVPAIRRGGGARFR